MKLLKRSSIILTIVVLLLSSVIIPAKAEIGFIYPKSIEEYDEWIVAQRANDNLPDYFVNYHEKKLSIFGGEFYDFLPQYTYNGSPYAPRDGNKFAYSYGYTDKEHKHLLLEVKVKHAIHDNMRNLIDNDPLGQTMLYQRTQVSGVVARERLNYYYVDGYLETILFRIEGAEIHVDLTAQSNKGKALPENSVVNQLLSVDEEEFQEGYAILWDAMGGLVEYPSNFSLYLRMAWTITLKIFLPVLAIAAACFGLYKLFDAYKRYRWKKTFGS